MALPLESSTAISQFQPGDSLVGWRAGALLAFPANTYPLVWNVQTYGGAVGDEQYLYDIVTTATSATITSAAGIFTADDAGKLMFVRGAGTGGRDLITTILTYNSATSVTLAAVASTTLAAGYGKFATDDTVAVQNTINDSGGGRIYFPEGGYGFGGALIAPYNSQLYIPVKLNTQTTRTHYVLEGAFPPNYALMGLDYDILPPTSGSRLSSYLPAVSGILPSFIATKAGTNPLGTVDENYNYLTVKNLSVVMPPSPTGQGVICNGINGLNTASLICEHVAVFTESSLFLHHGKDVVNQVAGIITSKVGTEASSALYQTVVWGFRTGYVLSEHCYCMKPQAFGNAIGFMPLRSNCVISGDINGGWNEYDLYIPDGTQYTITEGTMYLNLNMEFEIISGLHIASFHDANDNARGFIRYCPQRGHVGYDDTAWVKVGGTMIETVSLTTGARTWTTATRPSIPVEGMQAVNTDTHNVEYYDGTEWRKLTSTAV